jgi:hypothetical protein
MSLKIEIDVDKIAAEMHDMSGQLKADLVKGVQRLSAQTHGKIINDVDRDLHSSREYYKKSLTPPDEVSPGIWVISLEEKANWIEEGINPGTDMKPELLKHATKVSKEGYRYTIIPFKHSDNTPSRSTQYQQNLVGKIKIELAKRNIPWQGIEKDEHGNPRLGKLHSFNFGGGYPSLKANTEVLKGVHIYQSKGESGQVRRDILTMRTVSDGPKSANKWIHPGLTGKKFFDRAHEWALNEWETVVLPSILSKY